MPTPTTPPPLNNSAQMSLLQLLAGTQNTSVIMTDTIDADTLAAFESTGRFLNGVIQTAHDAMYVLDTLGDEQKRIDKLNADSRKNIYKVRQMTLNDAYSKYYYGFVTNVMLFTCFVTMLCLTIGGAYITDVIKTPGVAFGIILAVLIVYALAMMYVFVSMKMRTKDDWHQFYFMPSKEVKEATQGALK